MQSTEYVFYKRLGHATLTRLVKRTAHTSDYVALKKCGQNTHNS